MEHLMARVVAMTRLDVNALPPLGKTTKLGEEFGEFCEAVLLHEKLIRFKDTIGTPIEEGADIILMVLDVLATCYPNHAPDRLISDLEDMMARKIIKWQGYMKQEEGDAT